MERRQWKSNKQENTKLSFCFFSFKIFFTPSQFHLAAKQAGKHNNQSLIYDWGCVCGCVLLMVIKYNLTRKRI